MGTVNPTLSSTSSSFERESPSIPEKVLQTLQKIYEYIVAFFAALIEGIKSLFEETKTPLIPAIDVPETLKTLPYISKKRIADELLEIVQREPKIGSPLSVSSLKEETIDLTLRELWSSVKEILSKDKDGICSFQIPFEMNLLEISSLKSFLAAAKFPVLIVDDPALELSSSFFDTIHYEGLRHLRLQFFKKPIHLDDLKGQMPKSFDSFIFRAADWSLVGNLNCLIEYTDKKGRLAIVKYREEFPREPRIRVTEWKTPLNDLSQFSFSPFDLLNADECASIYTKLCESYFECSRVPPQNSDLITEKNLEECLQGLSPLRKSDAWIKNCHFKIDNSLEDCLPFLGEFLAQAQYSSLSIEVEKKASAKIFLYKGLEHLTLSKIPKFELEELKNHPTIQWCIIENAAIGSVSFNGKKGKDAIEAYKDAAAIEEDLHWPNVDTRRSSQRPSLN